jgi:hypothetical protein
MIKYLVVDEVLSFSCCRPQLQWTFSGVMRYDWAVHVELCSNMSQIAPTSQPASYVENFDAIKGCDRLLGFDNLEEI